MPVVHLNVDPTPDEELVRECAKLLESAKSGKLRALAVVQVVQQPPKMMEAAHDFGSGVFGKDADEFALSLIGALSTLQMRISHFIEGL